MTASAHGVGAPVTPIALSLAALGLGALTLAASSARAQSSTSGSAFNAGYGLSSGQLAKGVNVSLRDANGNLLIVDGVVQAGSDQSMFASHQTSGAGDSYSGAGGQGGSAIGNNLQVSVSGSYNTVVVTATQTNTAPVTSKTVLNGQVDLNGN